MVSVYADEAGETHFADVELDFAVYPAEPPAPALEVSEPYAAKTFVVVRIPPDWKVQWHSPPQRQVWIGLSGSLRVTVSDGETREIPPGVPWLMEDIVGKGHVTTATGREPAVGAVTQLVA